jgi:hypothetical protein
MVSYALGSSYYVWFVETGGEKTKISIRAGQLVADCLVKRTGTDRSGRAGPGRRERIYGMASCGVGRGNDLAKSRAPFAWISPSIAHRASPSLDRYPGDRPPARARPRSGAAGAVPSIRLPSWRRPCEARVGWSRAQPACMCGPGSCADRACGEASFACLPPAI